jgi:lysylphosphatidylglycerol synthetase-like protein (DUF2156 family)
MIVRVTQENYMPSKGMGRSKIKFRPLYRRRYSIFRAKQLREETLLPYLQGSKKQK